MIEFAAGQCSLIASPAIARPSNSLPEGHLFLTYFCSQLSHRTTNLHIAT